VDRRLVRGADPRELRDLGLQGLGIGAVGIASDTGLKAGLDVDLDEPAFWKQGTPARRLRRPQRCQTPDQGPDLYPVPAESGDDTQQDPVAWNNTRSETPISVTCDLDLDPFVGQTVGYTSALVATAAHGVKYSFFPPRPASADHLALLIQVPEPGHDLPVVLYDSLYLFITQFLSPGPDLALAEETAG
jgi:hypothetical protein